METEDLSKARFVKVHSYLEERAAQVADLLQVCFCSHLNWDLFLEVSDA